MTPPAPDLTPGPPSEANPERPPRGPGQPDRMRALAALTCALQSLALLVFCAFYLWELAQGGSDDATRVVMSAVLIAVFALALGLLARAWVVGANWPNTPTVVWNALLLPVAWSLFQSGRTMIAAAVALLAATGIVASIGARTAGGEGKEDPAEGDRSSPQSGNSE